MKHYLFVLASLLVVNTINAQPQKPEWPVQFDATFGLYVPTNETAGIQGVTNSTSHFYYNYNIQASVIDYPTNCIPLGFSGADQISCRWYFNPKGAFLYFPDGVSSPNPFPQCCLLFPGVGTVPPNFLAGFNFALETIQIDYYGYPHYANLWVGDGGFQYWTDVTTGDDVAFIDGGSVLWTFGPLNVVSQNSQIFNLPSNECLNTCPGVELDLVSEPLLRLLMNRQ